MKRKLIVLVIACIIPLTSSAAYFGWSDWEAGHQAFSHALVQSGGELGHLGIILVGIAGLALARKYTGAN